MTTIANNLIYETPTHAAVVLLWLCSSRTVVATAALTTDAPLCTCSPLLFSSAPEGRIFG